MFLGNGDGTFQAPVSYSAGGNGTDSVSIGDVNGDGYPDLITANCGKCLNACDNGTVGVLLGGAVDLDKHRVPRSLRLLQGAGVCIAYSLTLDADHCCAKITAASLTDVSTSIISKCDASVAYMT